MNALIQSYKKSSGILVADPWKLEPFFQSDLWKTYPESGVAHDPEIEISKRIGLLIHDEVSRISQ